MFRHQLIQQNSMLHLKSTRTDLSSVLQTFNRYNYTIKASYMDNDSLSDMLDDRYEMFMRYLNV